MDEMGTVDIKIQAVVWCMHKCQQYSSIHFWVKFGRFIGYSKLVTSDKSAGSSRWQIIQATKARLFGKYSNIQKFTVIYRLSPSCFLCLYFVSTTSFLFFSLISILIYQTTSAFHCNRQYKLSFSLYSVFFSTNMKFYYRSLFNIHWDEIFESKGFLFC